MGSIWVREFRGGLDTRRLPETAAGGTLIRAFDCHINKGGEIEQRAGFEHVYKSPSNRSVGLGAVPGDALYIFGHRDTAPAGMPEFMKYQQCVHPDGRAPEFMRDFDVYNSKPAVILRYPGNERYAFYNGTPTDEQSPPRRADSGWPSCLLTHKQKLMIGAGTVAWFSDIRKPLDFTTGDGDGVGTGFLDFAYETSGGEGLYAMEPYDDGVAFFTPEAILIWSVDVDLTNAAATSFRQKIVGTGTESPMSVTGFTNGDILYLHHTGIRSLRSVDSSRRASSIDIGTPIDSLVSAQFAAQDERQVRKASAVIEPKSGNLWVALGDRIYVLAYHQQSKVSAWSVYRPGFSVEAMQVFNNRVFLRSGDDIFVYGGLGDYYYSATVEAVAWTTYLDADRPSTAKHGRGIHAAVRGEWEVRAAMDPNNLDASDRVAVLDGTTYGQPNIPFEAEFHHVSLRFKCTNPPSGSKPGIVSSALIHHDLDDLED